MVYLEFVEERNGDLIYDYMPEKRTATRGRVSVNRSTRERKIIKGTPDGDWWPAYHSQALKKVNDMIDSGVIEKETFSAWY